MTPERLFACRRRDYTKRQWRRLWPKIKAAAYAAGRNPHWVIAPYEMVFFCREADLPKFLAATKFEVNEAGLVPVLP